MKDVREALADAALEAQKEVKELKAENKQLVAGIDKVNNVGVQLRRENNRLKGDCKCLNENLTIVQEELLKHRWIPVSERLPEYNKTVLISDGKNISFGWFVDKCYNNPAENHDYWASEYHTRSDHPENITHWKPIILPGQALKGEVNGKE